jgi:hypothetical protein
MERAMVWLIAAACWSATAVIWEFFRTHPKP